MIKSKNYVSQTHQFLSALKYQVSLKVKCYEIIDGAINKTNVIISGEVGELGTECEFRNFNSVNHSME